MDSDKNELIDLFNLIEKHSILNNGPYSHIKDENDIVHLFDKDGVEVMLIPAEEWEQLLVYDAPR